MQILDHHPSNLDILDTLVDSSGVQNVQALATLLDSKPERLPELANALGLAVLTAEQQTHAQVDFTHISLAEALTQRVLPLQYQQQGWLLAEDPFSLALRQWMQHFPLSPALASPTWISNKLNILGKQQRTLDQLEQQNGDNSSDTVLLEISPASIAQESNAVIKLVNATLFDALQSRASDIHLSAEPDGLAVKYRIDGVLHTIRHCTGQQHAEQVISRLKVLSGMDIAERRIPQDGRFKAAIHQRPVDFRVSVVPGIHGEDAVLRVLDKSHDQTLSLELLGFDDHTQKAIRQLTHMPHGMVLVTGPTGSGKSTTLYAALSELNSGESKIITIEDPIEYQLNSVLQIPVNDKKGLTFARGLRAVLRHDPDIILVGEIRDSETAGIAVQAALTGHVVLSSVHANNAFSVLERFLYMQVEPASLITALNGVVAQRLVRGICPSCAVDVDPEANEITLWQASRLREMKPLWRRGQGCETCRHSGYHGRLALAEVLSFSDTMKEALLARASTRHLREVALNEGFIPLKEIALRAVLEGKTTLQEINRVIGQD
ncbi:GspE/PulE family protein [Pectobacterium zantedeschiae]|uniref:GspE/PulE family protein n=1 Tax=Pectobacterium zantedeschiae TaxID=2034769 RepID=UPI00101BEC07|nr:GspE/PulE family protein [Pectobacterium zantedeschiae]RYC43347.1 GspE family protein [Pectobacterium zantedeschiae]